MLAGELRFSPEGGEGRRGGGRVLFVPRKQRSSIFSRLSCMSNLNSFEDWLLKEVTSEK
jgi:hypothetical protein